MTKTIRRIFSIGLVLAMCMTLALTASASSDMRSAGIYGFISGESAQDAEDMHKLNTTTRVTRNPDGAYLKTEALYYDVETLLPSTSATSEAGVTGFVKDLTIYITIEGIPNHAYVNHYVIDPETSEIIYDAYTETEIVWDMMGISVE